MNELEMVQQLMTEIGPASPEITTVVQQAEDRWVLILEDEDQLSVEYHAETGRLSLVADLGIPEATRRTEILEALLCYNMLRNETGGVTMALAGIEGDVMQMTDLYMAELGLDLLTQVVLNFGALAQVWRAFILYSGDQTPRAPMPGGFPGIRV